VGAYSNTSTYLFVTCTLDGIANTVFKSNEYGCWSSSRKEETE